MPSPTPLDPRPSPNPNLLRGALAGALGGVAGGVVKLLCEVVAPPRSRDREAPPAILLERIAGRPLSEGTKNAGALAIHFAMSVAASAAYGAAVETFPVARAGGGTLFGLAFWAGAHELALPALELTPPLGELPVAEQVNEAVTHALFGGVVEAVRGSIRGRSAERRGVASEDGLQ